MAGIYPLSRIQQFDKDTGKPLSGGKLYLFPAGTDTPLNAYKDFGLSVLHPFPIPCDAAGRLPMIFLADGSYKHRLTNQNGVVQFSDDSVPVTGPSSGGGGGGTPVDPNGLLVTRDLKVRFDDQPLAGYVRLNGRTIGSATSGATERANADTLSLFTALWPYANISVPGGKGISAAADWSANKPLTLPDCAGRLLGGVDNMGNGAQNRITQANLGVDPTLLGAVGGEEKHTLANAEMPVHSHSGVSGGQSQQHTHPVTEFIAFRGTGSGTAFNFLVAQDVGGGTTTIPASGPNSVDHTHAIPSDGGGNGHNNLPPLALFTVYIRL